ncbi:MAG: 2-oxoacid:acceptor oxidoreductase family protein [Armatimonadetes bacterium]|nr:2-oxoacid:acceptor oxidoreductase family protein [Armatimonadota bacterium]MDW8154441.1 2-oxoacid:acceptor oxidoreductase family protein [Armatimonadota bacterium]
MRETRNPLIVGVGGQGVLLASNILAAVCLERGYDVKKSEVKGMAQRGGAVVSFLRYGPRVHSPLVERGRADGVLSLEWAEGFRWAGYLRPGDFWRRT